MYRHLLVPVDGTDLSTATTEGAVELARTLGARITFFHAQADHAAALSGDAEVVRLTSPADFTYAFQDRPRELLAKAESAARRSGVTCASLTAVANAPHRAILAAARQAGCDLIYMASHGRRSQVGMLLGSQTLRVLRASEIPVLVAAMREPPASARALGIIRDEHRSLGAVLYAWMQLLEQAAAGGPRPAPELLRAMLHYLRTFPVALHHPKEESHLFRKLRERRPEVEAELEWLEGQHAVDQQMVGELAEVVERTCSGAASAAELREAVAEYACFMSEHLRREEALVLPAAERHLTDADWDEVLAAFAQNGDPRFDRETDAEYRRLFSRIVNLAAKAPAAVG
ncbi:MAG TPA: universal stress protein [Anaeromyxobacteraceae bacterium]|nr:universal stress protein [Anaeromyxobacteraceae bacterium]